MSPDQAQLLAMLVQILGVERCIEVGVYTVCPLLIHCLIWVSSDYIYRAYDAVIYLILHMAWNWPCKILTYSKILVGCINENSKF